MRVQALREPLIRGSVTPGDALVRKERRDASKLTLRGSAIDWAVNLSPTTCALTDVPVVALDVHGRLIPLQR
ncbi:MAG: hypothetical protein M3Z31_18010 [Pseudomonadota bacterium]|nr:hypothetical protein [Pseudomonadota bacterium]